MVNEEALIIIIIIIVVVVVIICLGTVLQQNLRLKVCPPPLTILDFYFESHNRTYWWVFLSFLCWVASLVELLVFTSILSEACPPLPSSTDSQTKIPPVGRTASHFCFFLIFCCWFQSRLLLCILELFPVMLASDIRLPCALQWCAASPGETPVRRSLRHAHSHEC